MGLPPLLTLAAGSIASKCDKCLYLTTYTSLMKFTATT